jgi:hypothetical protein
MESSDGSNWANGAAVLLVVSLHKPEAVQVRMASA